MSKFTLTVALCCINFSIMVLVLYIFEQHIGLSDSVQRPGQDWDGDQSGEQDDEDKEAGVRSPWWKYVLLVFLPPFLMLPTIVCSLKYAGCLARNWNVS